MRYEHLASRLYNVPLLLTPDKAAMIAAVFAARIENRAALESPQPEQKPARRAYSGGTVRTDAGYYRTAEGVALIPIVGTLIHRGDSMDAMSGLLSYSRVAGQVQAAAADPRVDAILLEIDSPGGEVNGLMDLAGKISNAATIKPTWAFANEEAYSAAYWIASTASALYLPRTGGVGSVGVIALHVDQSQMDAKRGVVYTAIHAGARKADFSSHAPLSDTARAIAQEEIDRLYGMFVDAVAQGRGIDAEVVRSTEAGLLNPEAAIEIGFADGIATFDETLAQITAEAKSYRYRGRHMAAASPTLDPEVDIMAGEKTTATELAEAQARGFKDGEAAAATKLAEADAKAKADIAAASKAASDRVLAILSHKEAEGRGELAKKLAATDMSVEQAIELLTAAPKPGAKADNPLDKALRGKNPQIGADVDKPDSDGGVKVINAGDIFAKRRAQAGHAPAKA